MVRSETGPSSEQPGIREHAGDPGPFSEGILSTWPWKE